MSLYQCDECGCCENTATGLFWARSQTAWFDWAGIEDRKGKALCCACAPAKDADGNATEYGAWHDRFKRVFLPKGQFKTNNRGNLEHIETGSENYRDFAISPTS